MSSGSNESEDILFCHGPMIFLKLSVQLIYFKTSNINAM